ncbi:MAG: hypothetical protein JO091_09875 [Acidobacteriaceae bacterium]|nr:hypothetical protein [Acidobacteriaceae bacterium]
MTRAGWEVSLKTFAACAGLYMATQFLSRRVAPVFVHPDFCWAAGFAMAQCIAVALLCFYLIAVRAYTRLRETLYDQIRPAIRDRVLTLAFEGESWAAGAPKRGPSRHVLEESIAQALITLKASGRDRLARFAVEQGFVREWEKRFLFGSNTTRKRAISLLALVSPFAGSGLVSLARHDRQTAVRVESYRALLMTDERGVDAVFRSVLRDSFHVRTLLADDLKRHASYLLANTVPEILARNETVEVARCFELLIAWKRALPSLRVGPWLSGEPDPLIWPLVLGLLPYAAPDDRVEEYLTAALNSDEPRVQCEAAHAAGSLKLERLIPQLCIAMGKSKQLALVAARALAEMGRAGERSLESMVTAADRTASLAAMEALERAAVRAA